MLPGSTRVVDDAARAPTSHAGIENLKRASTTVGVGIHNGYCVGSVKLEYLLYYAYIVTNPNVIVSQRVILSCLLGKRIQVFADASVKISENVRDGAHHGQCRDVSLLNACHGGPVRSSVVWPIRITTTLCRVGINTRYLVCLRVQTLLGCI
jgi:hypothetical protein